MKTKKASFFVPATTIFVAITLITAIVLLQNKADSPAMKPPIGQRQFKLFSTYQRAENALAYLGDSANYAVRDTIFAFANNSGYAGESSCGRFGSFNSWGFNDQCYPADIKPQFVSLFSRILNWSYLTKHDDQTDPKEDGLNLSKLYNVTIRRDDGKSDIVSFGGKDGQTYLVVNQLGPYLNYSFLFNNEQINYSIKYSFRGSTEPDVSADLEYLKEKAVPMADQFKDVSKDTIFSDVMPDGTTMLWHNGGCVKSSVNDGNMDGIAERFYKFVEIYQDCFERELPGDSIDEFKQLKAKCGEFDLTQIDDGYSYVIRPEGARIYLALRHKERDEKLKKDVEKELWGAYVDSQFALIYRYTCGDNVFEFGRADCNGPTGQCSIDLRSNVENCEFCGNKINSYSAPFSKYSCVEGREYCVACAFGAQCTSGSSAMSADCWYDEWNCIGGDHCVDATGNCGSSSGSPSPSSSSGSSSSSSSSSGSGCPCSAGQGGCSNNAAVRYTGTCTGGVCDIDPNWEIPCDPDICSDGACV